MRANIQSTKLHDSMENIDSNLANAEKILKDMVKVSIEEIKDDKAKEKLLISLWVSHANSISDFFFEECERTNNKFLYKEIVKCIMFNK